MSIRLPFAGALEGNCLPTREFAVAFPDGHVETHVGNRLAPDALRYVDLTMVGGFKFAGQAQNSGATWEWVEDESWTDSAGVARTGRWHNHGKNFGVRPVIYDRAGTLHIAQDEGPQTPTDGWAYLGADGQPVRIVPYDQARDIHEFSVAGPFVVGQSSIDGIDVLFNNARYQLEPGDVHTIWARMGSNGALAVATRKLAQHETVLIWIDADDVPNLPLAPRPTDPTDPTDPIDPTDPTDPEEPHVPTFPFNFNPTGRLDALRQGFPTPLGARHAEFLVRACRIVGFGAGLLKKDGGTHVTLPNGVNVSQDWMVFPNGSGTDFLSDGEGAATISWGEAQANPGTLVDVSGLFTDDPPIDPPVDPPADSDLAKRVLALEGWKDTATQRLTSHDTQLADDRDVLDEILNRVEALEKHPGGGAVDLSAYKVRILGTDDNAVQPVSTSRTFAHAHELRLVGVIEKK